MANYDYDLFTIGAGSGGVRASRIAGGFGARVGIAEERYLGGTCVNVGCVPKKLFVYASHFHEDFEDAAGFGWRVGESSFDWSVLMENKNKEIARLNGIYKWLLENANVDLYEGTARLVDEHTVAINLPEGEKIVTADNILIATGGWPRLPHMPGGEHGVTSNEVFAFDELPKRVLIVGGGYIGVEFAGIFNGLGVDTTLVYRGGMFLRGFDEDIQTFVRDEMEKKGIDLQFQTLVTNIDKINDELHVTLSPNVVRDLQGERVVVVDHVVFAIGRVPMTKNIGLENVGVKLAPNGSIIVDEYSQTNVQNIYAVGDVTNRVNLTPVAIAEGMALANTLFNNRPTIPNYENIPSAVFSQPPIGTVGLTEAEARAKFANVDIYRENFRGLKHTLSGRDERTLMKLIVDADTDRVVGLHMAGADAGEIVQGFAVAMKAGATKAVFDDTIGIHPTSAEEFVTMRTKAS
ncbi:MAG: glutathione-disulfide reductase [Chloroflexota bacterium]